MDYQVTMSNEKELEELYKLYDHIVSITYVNIFSLTKDKDIILKEYSYKDKTARTFFEVAAMVAYFYNKEIYLQTSLIDFICTRIKSKNKHVRWISPKKEVDGIKIHEVAKFEANANNGDERIFEEIFDAYYERKK